MHFRCLYFRGGFYGPSRDPGFIAVKDFTVAVNLSQVRGVLMKERKGG